MALVVFSTALEELLQIHVFRRTCVIFKKAILQVWNTLKSRSKISHQILVVNIACFFLYHMSKGHIYDDIVKKYYDDLIKNDGMAVRFVKRLKLVSVIPLIVFSVCKYVNRCNVCLIKGVVITKKSQCMYCMNKRQ